MTRRTPVEPARAGGRFPRGSGRGARPVNLMLVLDTVPGLDLWRKARLITKFIVFLVAIVAATAIVRPANWGKSGTLFHDVKCGAIAITRNGPQYPVFDEFKTEVLERYPESTFLVPADKVKEVVQAINANRSEDTAILATVGEIKNGHQIIEIKYDSAACMIWDRYEATDKGFIPLEQARLTILTPLAILLIASIIAASLLWLKAWVLRARR